MDAGPVAGVEAVGFQLQPSSGLNILLSADVFLSTGQHDPEIPLRIPLGRFRGVLADCRPEDETDSKKRAVCLALRSHVRRNHRLYVDVRWRCRDRSSRPQSVPAQFLFRRCPVSRSPKRIDKRYSAASRDRFSCPISISRASIAASVFGLVIWEFMTIHRTIFPLPIAKH